MFHTKTFCYASLIAMLALLLGGCPESNNINQGHVQIAQTQICLEHDDDHDEDEGEDEGDEEHGHCEDEHDDEGEEGEEDHEHEDVKVIEDTAEHEVELLKAYLVLDQLQLTECTTAASLLKRSLDGILGTAIAQGGHDHGHDHGGGGNDVPDDQRNLNRPHVIDLMNPDESLLVLGNLRVPAGRYCGLRVSLVPAQDDAFGLPEDMSLIGTGFYLLWEQDIDGDGMHEEKTVDSSDIALPMTVSLDFEEALTVGTGDHHVVLAVIYGHIFEDIDLSTVTDAELPALLLEGIEHALEVHDLGDGKLD